MYLYGGRAGRAKRHQPTGPLNARSPSQHEPHELRRAIPQLQYAPSVIQMQTRLSENVKPSLGRLADPLFDANRPIKRLAGASSVFNATHFASELTKPLAVPKAGFTLDSSK